MFISSCRSPVVAGILSVAIAVPPGATLYAQAKPAAAPQAKPPIAPPPVAPAPPVGTNADTGWPRTVALKSGSVVWHQPQVESWAEQKQILAWSAVSYQPNGAKEPALGTIKIEGPTRRARRSRRDHGSQDHRVQLQDTVARSSQDAGGRRAGASRTSASSTSIDCSRMSTAAR